MPISADVLASTLQDLMPGYSEQFVTWHPLMEKIVLNGNLEKKPLQGPWQEFTAVTNGPGAVTTVVTGNEVINGGRRDVGVRGNVYLPRMIYAYDVPHKDLSEVNGEQDFANLIKNYPEMAIAEFHEWIADQLGSGGSANVPGFVTLNGQQTFSPNGTARSGLFEFAAPASQTSTVHGIVSEGGSGGVTGWYNQYEDITSMADNGLYRLRRVFGKAQRVGKAYGTVDLMIGDEASYLNYMEELSEPLRVAKIEDKSPQNVREGLKCLTADFYIDDAIDPAGGKYSGAAADGVVYGFKTAAWNMRTLGHGSPETKGFFENRGPIRVPDRDMTRFEIVLSAGIFTTMRRCNFAVTGMGTA